ncbi:hypothetical protein F2P56_022665 [Juglans regia]|uniref:Reverse transcriptase Ty1/copia-type domain-containing protein n=1 Tax=Juglans regia TaxID=51240 RepID=A0A833UL14_JUGRE|nr:hypothetical protein F2P56_022665 [Juglans regia]
MEQPSGFVDQRYPHHVCKLQKSIYGLKQALRAWFNKLANTLLALNNILTGNNVPAMTQLVHCLQQHFTMKDLGSLNFFLGIHAQYMTNGMLLSQSKYTLDLLSRFKMKEAKPAKTPLPAGSQLSQQHGDPLENATEYRQLVGALQYLTLIRPDISFSVNQLCQFMHNPTSTHWTTAKRVLRYLKGSLNHGLMFTKGSLTLNAYSDSDWARNPDDRRSITGYAIYLGPCLISWSAKKQTVVSKSSTEAEYRSLALTTAELYWIRMLLQELKVPITIAPTLWCDNLRALSLATNPIFHARTKHIEVDYHFIKEKVVNKDITTRYLSTIDQVVDIFTKGLTSARFLLLRDKLKVIASPISLQGDVKVSRVSSASDGGLTNGLTQGHIQLDNEGNGALTSVLTNGIDSRLHSWKDRSR